MLWTGRNYVVLSDNTRVYKDKIQAHSITEFELYAPTFNASFVEYIMPEDKKVAIDVTLLNMCIRPYLWLCEHGFEPWHVDPASRQAWFTRPHSEGDKAKWKHTRINLKFLRALATVVGIQEFHLHTAYRIYDALCAQHPEDPDTQWRYMSVRNYVAAAVYFKILQRIEPGYYGFRTYFIDELRHAS